MRVWKLTPRDLSDPIWQDWKSKPMFVRADTEREARQLAETKTTAVRPTQSGVPIPLNPWGTHKKIEASCWRQSAKDVTDGEPTVLND